MNKKGKAIITSLLLVLVLICIWSVNTSKKGTIKEFVDDAVKIRTGFSTTCVFCPFAFSETNPGLLS